MRLRLPRIRLPRIRLGFPLLVKDLTEQANRARTYVVRVVYACLLFLTAWALFWQTLPANLTDPFGSLGEGGTVLDVVVGLQFAGIYLFLPAMTAGVLTFEKERNSLGMLFITKLGPWTILFEKILGRLVPMFAFLLLALPLLAFAYSLGGVSTDKLIGAVWILSATCWQVAALAVMCSAYFRTTAGAFVASYLIGSLIFFVGPMFLIMGLGWPEALSFIFAAEYTYHFSPDLDSLVFRSIPVLFSTLCFLGLARFFIVRRAFVPPRNLLLLVFRKLDTFFSELNRRYGDVVLIRKSTQLPADEPIAWRETTKKTLGTTRYLVRTLLALEIPSAILCVIVATQPDAYQASVSVSLALFLLWIIVVLMIGVQSASLIAGERSRETLDVLLASPLSGREIIKQKFRGVRRQMYVLLVPFATLIIFQAWWRDGGFFRRESFDTTLYQAVSLLSVAVYLPLAAWLSLYISLRVKSQSRAILGSLAVLFAWCTLPVLVLLPLFDLLGINLDSGLSMLLLTSPAAIITLNEMAGLQNLWEGYAWPAVAANFAGYGLLLAIFRRMCFYQVDRYLGRRMVPGPTALRIERASRAAAGSPV